MNTKDEEVYWSQDLRHDSSSYLLISRISEGGSVLPYNAESVLEYCKSWCSAGNDCPDGEFASDCTHFVSHALSKAGVLVNLPEITCSNGVCIRVNELAAAFFNSRKKYTNVSRIESYSLTSAGDFCFIPSFFGLSKDHVMLLGERSSEAGARVFGHTTNRCNQHATFDAKLAIFYRIV